MKFCPQCGSTFESGARFCQECGFDIQTFESTASDASETHPKKPDNAGVPFDNQIKASSNPLERFCSECGTSMEAEDRFCPGCGFDNQQLEVELGEEEKPTDKPQLAYDVVIPPLVLTEIPIPEPPKATCQKCGTRLEAEDRFCPSCGFDNQLLETEPVVEEKFTEEPTEKPLLIDDVVIPPVALTEIPIPELPKFTCPKCGTLLEAEERFCPGCGFDTQQLETEAVAEEKFTEEPTDEALLTRDVIIPPLVLIETPKKEIIPIDVKKPEPDTGQFCPECGTEMPAADVFCQECGYKRDGVETVTTDKQTAAFIPPPPIVPPVKVQVPPAVLPVVPPATLPPVQTASDVESPEPKKKNKLLLVLLLLLLGLGVLGGGGYFVYKKFLQNPDNAGLTTTITEEDIPTSDIEEEMQQVDITEIDEPVETQATMPEPEKKNTPPKEKTKKKQAEPKVKEPVKEEPAKTEGPFTVVMKEIKTEKSPRSLYNNFNTEEVKSGPKGTNRIKFKKPTIITRIITFHHNNGNGAPAGTITFEGKKNETGGPWQARNAPGSDGTENGKWICEPNARMEAGTYKIVVSDDNSWSFNGKSNRKGFVIVEGYELD